VTLDEITTLAIALEQGIIDENGLHRGTTTGLEGLLQRREIGGPIGLAHCLEHLDGDDAIVLPGFLAVILESEAALVRQASLLDALARILQLLAGEGDATHTVPGDAGGVFGKTTPAAADLQDGTAIVQAQHVEHALVLVGLCRIE